jgi:orotidine-5'-phosphate decarboxylase
VDFLTKLNTSARERDSWLCVGLDPVVEHLPVGLPGRAAGVVEFCSRIVLATAPYACAFKPNIAFFEALGADAFAILKDVVDSVPDGIPVILDAKRGDIGSTAEMYARAYFDELGVDAVTVNPYMGWDAVRPFAERPNKAAFVLCLTSNQSAESVQMLPVEGEPLFLRIAEMVASWGISCGLVVGATRADMIAAVRARCREQVLLIPGIGAQGGDLKRSVELGAWQGGGGALINASRSLLYASGGEDYAEAAAAAAVELRADISRCQPST